jgi:hypothetical protein
MKKKKKQYQPSSTEVIKVDSERLLVASGTTSKSWVKTGADVWTKSGNSSASRWNLSSSGDADTRQ